MTSNSTDVRYRWKLLRAGPFLIDGGGMFGLVPKPLWNRMIPCDEKNRIALTHNCLLLERIDQPGSILIETGSGDKNDEKTRKIFGLTDWTISQAVHAAGVRCDQIDHVIVSHLHFDHAGGLTRRVRPGETADWADGAFPAGVKLTFPRALITVQQREWDDALVNRSVMTRTYLRDHLDPIRDRLRLVDSPVPFLPGVPLDRNALPATPLEQRQTEVLPGIFVFQLPGHTWGQQAIRFTDDRGRAIVFTPDAIPTVHHIPPTCSLGYDVEPYMSMLTRHWFLREAAARDWVLVLDHEPGNPCQRVRDDDKGWYRFVPEVE